jgi:hypothetical protein
MHFLHSRRKKNKKRLFLPITRVMLQYPELESIYVGSSFMQNEHLYCTRHFGQQTFQKEGERGS